MLAFLGDLGLPELMVLVVIAALILAKDRGSPSDGSGTGFPRTRRPG